MLNKDELHRALNNWRRQILDWLAREMLKSAEDRRDAQEDLAIAHRNPGQVADDVVKHLWDKLNESSILLCRLDRVVSHIESMDTASLLILFQRTTKLNTYPWEGDAWQLPESIF